jgi:putative DNA primase/helicase
MGPVVQRVAQRFALAAAAGEVAIQLGVLPFPEGAANDAAERTFKAWIGDRGGAERREDQVAVTLVSAFLQRFGEARFAPWPGCTGAMSGDLGKLERIIPDLAGWRREDQFLINAATWREITKGHDARAVAAALAGKGYLERDKDGKNSILVTVNHQKQRVYAVSAAILEAGGAD